MATTRKCKICGKEYPYCKTVVKDGVFRWQDVACCFEHGSRYFELIEESRMTAVPVKKNEPKEQTVQFDFDEDVPFDADADIDDAWTEDGEIYGDEE